MESTKKNKTINPVIAIVFIGVLVFWLIGYLQAKTRDLPTFDLTQSIQDRDARIDSSLFTTKKIIDESNYTTIDFKYPQFKNAPPEFNEKIKTFLVGLIADHKKVSEDNWNARYETAKPDEHIAKVPAKDDRFPLYSSFEIVQANKDYISVVVKYGGFQGGAHGFENMISYNYDVKNKKELTLTDLYNAKSLDAMTDFISSVRISLLEQFARSVVYQKDIHDVKYSEDDAFTVESIYAGTEPKTENYSVFTFDNKNVTVYFGQYQVGPYVIGEPEVNIPRTATIKSK